MLMPKACQPPPPRPTQNAAPATRSGAKRCPARSDCRQLQPARQHLGTSSLSYVSAKCLGSGSHDIPGISISCSATLLEFTDITLAVSFGDLVKYRPEDADFGRKIAIFPCLGNERIDT